MITKTEALTARHFEHVKNKGSDKQPVRCRTMGKCQVWETRPNDFSLPVKHGLRNSFYITNANAHEWIVAS